MFTTGLIISKRLTRLGKKCLQFFDVQIVNIKLTDILLYILFNVSLSHSAVTLLYVCRKDICKIKQTKHTSKM